MKDIRGTLHYCLIQGLYWCSDAAVFVYASAYLLAQGFTNSEVGYVIALGSALSAILQPIVGTYADRSKTMVLDKMIVFFAGTTIFASGALLAVGQSFWLLGLFYILIIAFSQVLSLLAASYGMYFVARGVDINFGVGRGVGSLTFAIMSMSLGALIENYSVNLVPLSIMIIQALLIAATLTFPRQNLEQPIHEIDVDELRPHESLLAFLKRHKRYSFVLIGCILVFVGHTAVGNFMYQIVKYKGYGSKELGITMFIATFVELPALVALNKINRKFRSGLLLKISMIFFTIRPFLLFLAPNIFFVYLAMTTHVLGFGLYAGISMYYANHTIEREQHVRGQALMMSTMTIGTVLGSIVGGKLLDLADVPTLLLVCGIFIAIGTVVIFFSADRGDFHK